MGAINTDMDNTDTRTRTVKEWANIAGQNPDSARTKATRKLGRTVGQTSFLTADEWRTVYPDNAGQNPDKQTKKRSVLTRATAEQKVEPPSPKPEPQEVELPALETLRDWLVDALLIGLSVGHAALIWYELQATYGTYGFIGGGVVFGFIVAAVLLAADRTKNVTSTYSLVFALVVDLAAIRLHYDSFKEFGAPKDITIAVCAFLGGMSWGALFLFRHKKNN